MENKTIEKLGNDPIKEESLDCIILEKRDIEFKKIEGGRLTIHDSIYFQSDNDNPTTNSVSYELQTQTTEQPYLRRIKVANKWIQLDLGWLNSNYSLVLIEFKEKEDRLEKNDNNLKQVLIGTCNITDNKIIPFACINSKIRSIKFSPYYGNNLFVKSENGEHKIELMVFPK